MGLFDVDGDIAGAVAWRVRTSDPTPRCVVGPAKQGLRGRQRGGDDDNFQLDHVPDGVRVVNPWLGIFGTRYGSLPYDTCGGGEEAESEDDGQRDARADAYAYSPNQRDR